MKGGHGGAATVDELERDYGSVDLRERRLRDLGHGEHGNMKY